MIVILPIASNRSRSKVENQFYQRASSPSRKPSPAMCRACCSDGRRLTASEMGLQVVAYNLKRVMQILGVQPLIAAMRA
jgi:hypothetical protein